MRKPKYEPLKYLSSDSCGGGRLSRSATKGSYTPVIVVTGRDGSETDVVHVLHVSVLCVGKLQAWGPSVVHDVVDLQS
jgi:hypothetical protein